jgi:uncharacterized protein YprB with RNaseH-like and TPR domain
VDLRSKLARLAPPRVTVGLREAPPAPASNRIEELRSRLSELIDRSRQKQEQKSVARAAEIEQRLREAPLPFDELETDLGPLQVRTVRHPPSHLVGRIPIRTALTADAHSLSLLALDPGLASAQPRGALYLDTESTGLAGGTGTIPFLVGLAWFDGDDLIVEQLLLRRLGDEAPMLARVAERLRAATMIVSFNGKSFDMPLLRTRFVMNRVPAPTEPPHLDLVHLARRVHRTARGRGGVGDPRSGPTIERWTEDEELRRLTSCTLVAIARQLLGFARVDDVPSAEVPARYAHFLRSGDADAIRAVCDHNMWDVVSMAALVGVYADAVRSLDSEDEREFPALGGRDLVGIARTLRRAGDLTRARRAADCAVDASRDDDDLERLARRTRGGIAKGSRDNETALLDFGVLADTHDDREARLELAKLYEHRLRDPSRALQTTLAGTSELPDDAERRRARLEKKAARQQQLVLAPTRKRSKPRAK